MANRRNEQAEVICLIIFIVLALVLGVTTYFGFKGYGEQKAAAQTAKSELENVRSEAVKSTEKYEALKAKLGYPDGVKADEIVEQMKRDVATAAANARFMANKDSASTERASKYEGDEGSAPDVKFKDALADLKQKVQTLATNVAESSADRDQQITNAFGSIKTSDDQKDKFVDGVAVQYDEHANALSEAVKNYADTTESFVAQTKEFDKIKLDAKDTLEQVAAETAMYSESADRFADINLDLSRRIDELSEANFDRPDGVVVFADQVARTVRLSVGRADGVQPLMTFNVYPYDFLEYGGGSAKGVVEVVRTLEDHACEAKIISDDNGNPVRPGDLIYTSLWKPGEVEQFALDYNLDINGDGVSDLYEIVYLIESNGKKVAAYIDNDGKICGKITPEVTRIIVPNRALEDTLAEDASLDDDAKAKLIAVEEEFRGSAQANGVREMRLEDFLVRLDYKQTSVIYNSGNLKNPQAKNDVGGEPTVPMFRYDDAKESTAPGVPTVDSPARKVQSAEPVFRQRAPK